MADDKPKSTRGGKRAGAGRKPKGFVPAAKLQDIDLRAALEAQIPETIESEAQRHALDVVEKLVDVVIHARSDAARVSACNTILDRGYGKPSLETGVDMLPFLGKAPPKTDRAAVRELCRANARLAIVVLHKIATASDSETARVAASRSLLDRGLGTVAVARMTTKDKIADTPPERPESSWAALIN